MNKKIIWTLVLVVVLLVVVWAYSARRETAPALTETLPENTEAATNTQPGEPAEEPAKTAGAPLPEISIQAPAGVEVKALQLFVMAQVAEHNSAVSCYSAIRGNVYDLTGWISKHPGREKAILNICGKDGTSAFAGKHGGKEKQEQALSGMQIGVLTQ